MARLLYRLSTGAVRHRLVVVLVWLLVLVGAGVGALTLAGSTSDSFAIPGQESTDALDRINEEFGESAGGASARVVLQASDDTKLTDPSNAVQVSTLVNALRGLPGVDSASDPLDPANPTVDPDGTTGFSTVTYDAGAGEVTQGERDALTDAVGDARDGGLSVEVSGQALMPPVQVGGIAEVAGVVVAVIILTLTYGTLVTAGMNLLTSLVGVGIGVLGVTIVTGFIELASVTPILATMLGLAVGIDYTLFIVTRYRQELKAAMPVQEAIGRAVGTAGSAVVVAGTTVFIALVGLVVAGIPFLTQMGIAAAVTVVIAVLIALTLVPAVLGFLGERVLPTKQRPGRHEAPLDPTSDEVALPPVGRGFLRGWVGIVTRHRLVSLLAAVVALGVVALPVFSLQTTLVQSPSEGSTQARADDLLANAFGEGFLGPLTVLFEGDQAAERASGVSDAIADLSDVVTVTPPMPNGDDTAALLTVIPSSGPTSPDTEALVGNLRDLLAGTNGVDASVTGQTAVSVDVASTLDDALPVYLVLVVGLAIVLLILVFRSLVVPLIGVLGFLLTVGAALGATVAVFQWGWLADLVNLDTTGPLISLTPILVIGILFGLAMDYQVFLVSRMHEAYTKGSNPTAAVRTGFRQAAPVVVAAALIMFSVFAGFVPTGDATIKSIAFALAIGIAFDAFIVRMVLAPAALALMGTRAWRLPRWLHWLPELDVEGSALATGPVNEDTWEPEVAGAGAR